nr:MAG TPA: hypothetical protein [Caudoviricetes sp.]
MRLPRRARHTYWEGPFPHTRVRGAVTRVSHGTVESRTAAE